MLKNDIKIGMWYTYCCHLDLKQIETQDELENVVDSIGSNELEAEVWLTREEALLGIRSRWKDQETIKQINIMLSNNLT